MNSRKKKVTTGMAPVFALITTNNLFELGPERLR
jgi:hypothetical protein